MGTDDGGDHAADLSFLEIAPALGARPVDVSVTTGRATESWRAFMLEEVITNGGLPIDCSFLLMAYRDADAHTMLSAGYDGEGHFSVGSVIGSETRELAASAAARVAEQNEALDERAFAQ